MKPWPKVRLGEVLAKSEETVSPNPDTEYLEITVRLWGKGVVERGRRQGAEMAGTRRFVAKQEQFIVSRIDARNGAMGIVPKHLDGSLVTNDFPLFNLNRERLFPDFLGWLCRTVNFVDLCQQASEGTTNRVRLKEDRFLALEIPLPPLQEQRRIVERIEELSSLINEARAFRHQASVNTEALYASSANALFTTTRAHLWSKKTLGEIAEIRSGVTLGRRLFGKTIHLPYLRVANVQDGHLDLSIIKKVEVLETEADKWKLLAGDLLLTEGGDWDKLGRGTIWRGEIPNCIHQNHIFRLRTRPDEFIPEFLAALIGSPVGKKYFQAASKQTTNLASINQTQLKAFPVFQPPLCEQLRIVSELDAIQSQVDDLRRLQFRSASELETMLPAILDHAFRGELT